MANIKVLGATTTSVAAESEGNQVLARGMRDGSLITADWLTSQALRGRVFGVNVGTATSPTTLNATYGAGEPDLFVHVPAGTTIIPVYIGVQFEDTGTAQVMDVFAAASSVSDDAVTGTALTIMNARMDRPYGSACTATAVVTAAGTTYLSGNYIEFWRPYAGFAEDAFNGSTSWGNNMFHGVHYSLKDAGVPMVIKGAGSLNVFASGQAATGFIQALWVELPSSELT